MHSGMPRGARMSLTLNEQKWVALHSNSNSISKHAPQLKEIIDIVFKTTSGKP
jgi:hypothetical protein